MSIINEKNTSTPETGLSAALKKAQQYDTNSIESPIQSCPLQEEQIYIVPVRYACAEGFCHHPNLTLGLTKTHRTALRKLRKGYLYLWQNNTGLRQFTVTTQGTFIETAIQDIAQGTPNGGDYGIMLQANQPALFLFIEGLPLDQRNTDKLNNNASFRQQKMRAFNLEHLKLGSNSVQHSVHTSEADKVIAELLENKLKQLAEDYYTQYPNSINYSYTTVYSNERYQQSEQTLKQHITKQQQQQGWTTQQTEQQESELRFALSRYNKEQNLAEGSWSSVKWNKSTTEQWLKSVTQDAEKNRSKMSTIVYQAKLNRIKQTPDNPNDPEYKKLDKLAGYYQNALPSFLIALDDPIGIMEEVEKTQGLEAEQFQAWQAKHSIRTTIAQFIASLTTEQANELASKLTYRFKDNQFKPTEQQANQMLSYSEKITARYNQYLAAFKDADNRPFPPNTPTDEIELYLESRRNGMLPQHPYQHGKPFQSIVEPNDPLDQSVDNIVAYSRSYIPADIFTEVWDEVVKYSYEKQQNMQGSRAYAQVDKYIRRSDIDTWLNVVVPLYEQQRDFQKQQFLADRNSYHQLIYSNLEWRIDYTREDHSQYLVEVGTRCFMLQAANDEGSQQIAEALLKNNGADIFSMLITRGIPITERFVNYGGRMQDFVTAIGSQSNTTLLNLMVANIKSGNSFSTKQLIEATERASNASNGSWGTLFTSFTGGIIKLITYFNLNMVDGVLNKIDHIGIKYMGEPVFPYPFPVKALPAMIMAKLTKGIQIVKESNTWKVIGGGAEAIQQGVNEFVRTATIPKATLTAYKAIGKTGGIVAMVMLVVNARNAYNYAEQAQQNPNQTEQKQAETLSAYYYAGAALTGVIGASIDSALVAKGFSKSLIRAYSMTILGGIVLGFSSFYAASKDNDSLGLRIAEMGDSVDPALLWREGATYFQMGFFAGQAVLGLGLALNVLLGGMTAEAAIAMFSALIGPLSLFILAAGIVYFLTWYFERTPLQNFLAKCCWSRTPKYKDPTQQQLVEDLTDLVDLLFKPTLVGSFAAHHHYTNYGISGKTEINFQLENLAIYLPAADKKAIANLTLKGLPNNTKQPITITHQWLDRMYSEWIPADQGQGLILKANLTRQDISELEIALQYTNPIMALYNNQLIETTNQANPYYYYRLQAGNLGLADVTDIEGLKNCRYIKAQDPLIALTEQELDPVQNNKFNKGYSGA